MPVYKIRAEMPLKEFIGWHLHFSKRNKPAEKRVMTPEEVMAAFGCSRPK